jgi:hypothetical protein
VVGVMLANHDTSAAAGATLLFVTNFLAILIAGGVLLAVMGYGRASVEGQVRGRRPAAVVIGAATLLAVVPLAITGRQIAQNSWREYGYRSSPPRSSRSHPRPESLAPHVRVRPRDGGRGRRTSSGR